MSREGPRVRISASPPFLLERNSFIQREGRSSPAFSKLEILKRWGNLGFYALRRSRYLLISTSIKIMKPLIKIALIILVFCIPIAITMGIFTPLISRKHSQHYVGRYFLPENFSSHDMLFILERMKDDPEFAFYFRILPEDYIKKAADEIFVTMDAHRGKKALKEALLKKQARIDSLAMLLLSFDYGIPFYKNPVAFPDLNKTLWNFIFEEFKLNIMGATYKSTYELGFQFAWSSHSLHAAQKAQNIISQLHQVQDLMKSNK